MAATYTSNSDFEAYVPGWVTDSPSALTAFLERAERDVDAFLGPIPTRSATGLKLDPAALQDWEAAALSRAVCAQAEYRLLAGESKLAGGGIVKREKGPDFEREYDTSTGTGSPGSSLIGPKVRVELAPIRHLRRLTGIQA